MSVGLLFFKFLPMAIWGVDIEFDASMHITTAFLGLYVLWFFVDQDKEFHTPFYAISVLVLSIISYQRIAVDAHNDIGLLLGVIVSLTSIYLVEHKVLNKHLKF